MTKTLVIASIAVLAIACGKAQDHKQPPQTEKVAPASKVDTTMVAHVAEVAEVTVEQVDRWRASADTNPVVFDANGKGTRTKIGYVPGAVLLADYRDCSKELPEDKDSKLVFYCYNEDCGASHEAAEVAAKHGFKDVNVMTAGIVGWHKAGKPVEKL